MKIRSDFVSNSSSSSFVIVGKTYDKDDVRNIIDKKGDELLKMIKESSDSKFYEGYESIDDVIDEYGINEVFKFIGLDAEAEGDCGDGYTILVGLDPSKMKNEQTLMEFKEIVAEKLKIFGLEAEVDKISFVSGGTDASGYTFIE